MAGAFHGHGDNIPFPHTFNGALRTALHDTLGDKIKNSFFSAGPFLKKDNIYYFVTPRDLLLNGDENHSILKLAPVKEGICSSSLPDGLCELEANGIKETKEKIPPYISKEYFERYLKSDGLNLDKNHFLNNSDMFKQEYQIGIKIDPRTNTTEAKNFYNKTNMRLEHGVQMAGLIRDIDEFPSETYIKFGGEARMVKMTASPMENSILPKGGVIEKERVKFVLLTPAIYGPINEHLGGWRPHWIDTNNNVKLLDGPGKEKVKRLKKRGIFVQEGRPINAKLVAARVDKPVIITGYASGGSVGDLKGVKVAMLGVPAGSVYYFEADTPDDAKRLANVLNWYGADENSNEIVNTRTMFLGEKGFGVGVCAPWEYTK